MSLRVWFNQGFSSVADAIQIARAADAVGRFSFLASHRLSHNPACLLADEAWDEPGPLQPDAYAEWCLETCRAQHIDLFVPGNYRRVLSRHRSAFEAAGTRLALVASTETLDILEDKSATYTALRAGSQGLVRIPLHRVVRTAADFDAAYVELRRKAPVLCVKPTMGVFANGFYVLEETGDPLTRLLSGVHDRTGLDTFRAALPVEFGATPLMLMEFLPGDEYSVDALAAGGELVVAASRLKGDGCQEVSTRGPAIEIAHDIARCFCLDGLFNLQAKEKDGMLYLLEVNTRMSGGALYSEAVGLDLCYRALLQALGLPMPAWQPGSADPVRVVKTSGFLACPSGR